jgi:hypothetical protein
MTSWINLFKKEYNRRINKIVEDWCDLVPFSLVLPYESRDEILVRGVDL